MAKQTSDKPKQPAGKRVYYLRHGESELNAARRWAGATDTPLTERGHEQARQTAQAIKNQALAFDIIIASPLSRAHETAKHVATAIDYPHEQIMTDDRLVERNFGTLEATDDIAANLRYALGEWHIDDYPGVERLQDLQKRADGLIEYFNSLPHDTILVVAHGSLGRALKRSVAGLPPRQRVSKLANAELIKLI